MKRMVGFVLLALVALAACSPTFSTTVGNFSTPITNSLGRICWIEVDTSRAPGIGTATFRADATYDPGALALTDRVEVQIFGRAGAPASTCTERGEDVLPLSEPFELEREETQPIEVGGDAYGADLAGLVNGGGFWIGASAAGNVALGEESIDFEDGRISVGF